MTFQVNVRSRRTLHFKIYSGGSSVWGCGCAAGFLAGDARVAAAVLERQAFLPLQALFCQSCGAGGVEASVRWETQLRLNMGGATRELAITPQTT